MHSKDELHQWDELKQNQRAHLEDLLEQHWNPRGDTFTQPEEGYSLAGEDPSRSGDAIHFAPHWAHNSTRLLGTKEQSDGSKTVSSLDNVGVVEGWDGPPLNRTEGKVTEGTQSPLRQEDKSKFSNDHSSGIPLPVTPSPRDKVSPTEALGERVGSRFRPTKEPNPEPRVLARPRDNDTPEEMSILKAEEAKLQQEREELLLLHKRLDQEKEILKQQQMKREEEERQKEKKADSQHRPHDKHHHHYHHVQTTQTAGN